MDRLILVAVLDIGMPSMKVGIKLDNGTPSAKVRTHGRCRQGVIGPRNVAVNARSRIRVVVSVAALFLCSLGRSAAAPALVEDVSDPFQVVAQLCREADLIVIGVVREVHSRWEQFKMGPLIVSDAVVEVVVPIHGRVSENERIALSVQGGTVSGRSMSSSNDPFFQVGQRYLLLLHDPGTRGRRGVSIQDPGRMVASDDRLYIVGGEFGATLLQPEIVVPDERDMRLIWQQVCGTRASPPPASQ